MKTRALVIAALMALAVMVSARVAQAQESMVVNIPFDFTAGNSTLPAGEYTVKMSGAQHTLILIDRKDATASVFVSSNAASSAEPQSESKLIFNRYGDRYFLSQVWNAEYSTGRQLLKSAREKEMAQVAKNETQGQVTLVAELSPVTR
jgi:hypothetical protein